MPDAAAEFFRGPFDGLVLDICEIKRYCHLVKMQAEDEQRRFVMMPSLFDWDRVVRGNLDKDGPLDSLYPYEL